MSSSLSNHLPSGSKSRCVCARLLRLLAGEALGLSSARRRPVGGGVFRRSTPALLVLGMGPWVRRPRPPYLFVWPTLYILSPLMQPVIYMYIYTVYLSVLRVSCYVIAWERHGMAWFPLSREVLSQVWELESLRFGMRAELRRALGRGSRAKNVDGDPIEDPKCGVF